MCKSSARGEASKGKRVEGQGEVDEATALRREADSAMRLYKEGNHKDAIALAEELVVKHPDSGLVLHLAGRLHYLVAHRALKDSDSMGTAQHHRTAHEFFAAASRLVPNCIEISCGLSRVMFERRKVVEAVAEIRRAMDIPFNFAVDPAENSVAYTEDDIVNTTKEFRLQNAMMIADDCLSQYVAFAGKYDVPGAVRKVLHTVEQEGVAAALKQAKELANQYNYSARARYIHIYMDMVFARSLPPNMDKRQFLQRSLNAINTAVVEFKDSLVLAVLRAKLCFLLGWYDAVNLEHCRVITVKEKLWVDPREEDIPPESVHGEDYHARVDTVRKEMTYLLRKIILMANDFWCNMAIEVQNSFRSVRLDVLHEHYVTHYNDDYWAANTISDALSFTTKHRFWKFWMCPYCAGKKFLDTNTLLEHMRTKHKAGSVWPKLQSVLDPKPFDTSEDEYSLDQITVSQDTEGPYILHFSRPDCIFQVLFLQPASGIREKSFSEIRELKRTAGIEILEKIKIKVNNLPADNSSAELNMVYSEVQDLWRNFLQISLLDYRDVIAPLAKSFLWLRFKKHLHEKVTTKSIDTADIDAIFPNIADAPDIDAVFQNLANFPDKNASAEYASKPSPENKKDEGNGVDQQTESIMGQLKECMSQDEKAASKSIDTPDINVTVTIPTDAIVRNAAMELASGPSHENDKDQKDGVDLNTADSTDKNTAVEDASKPSHEYNNDQKNGVHVQTESFMKCLSEDEKAPSMSIHDADIDAMLPYIDDAPGGNSAVIHSSKPTHANNEEQKIGVDIQTENNMPSCSDDTLKTDGEDKKSDAHVEDGNSGETVNEKESDPPVEIVEDGNKLGAALENVDTKLKYDSPKGTSLSSTSGQNYIAENTASLLSGNDQSLASNTCYQRSIDVTKMNNEDLCCLNVVVQSLWNLRHFRDEFLRIMPGGHIAEILDQIFSANDSNIFQNAGRNCASEIMAMILERLHKSEISLRFGAFGDFDDLFGIKLKQRLSCSCGEWFGKEYTSVLHKLDASLPHTTKINSFAQLPMLIDLQSNREIKCNICSESVKQIGHYLSKGPDFFTIVLKNWLGECESQTVMCEALFGIASSFDISILYYGVTRPRPPKGVRSATKYRLASVICYVEQRYVCFVHDQDKWLKYDTMTVKGVNSFGELLQLYKEIHLQPGVPIYKGVDSLDGLLQLYTEMTLQPEVLIYEVIK